MTALTPTLRTLLRGEPLERAEAASALQTILTTDVPDAQIAAFLTLLQARGPSPEEIAGFADALTAAARPFPPAPDGAVDTCGTGGDGSSTFNISTTAALIAASAGAKVYKHGNRAATSKSGSADLLEALGIPVESSTEDAARRAERHGFTFLYARWFHPVLVKVAPVRSELGFPTIFNLLGPLLNPAAVRRQVVGVYTPAVQRRMAEALALRGSEHAMVLHGAGGLDEATPIGAFDVLVVRRGTVVEETRDPADFGFARCRVEDLQVANAEESRARVDEVLDGTPGPSRDAALLNAGLTLEVAGLVASADEGVERARQTLDDGATKRLVTALAASGRVS